MTQNELILKHITLYGSITQGTAKRLYGVGRLASRIHELRQAGADIEKEMIKVKCTGGRSAYVARYFLNERVHSA